MSEPFKPGQKVKTLNHGAVLMKGAVVEVVECLKPPVKSGDFLVVVTTGQFNYICYQHDLDAWDDKPGNASGVLSCTTTSST